MSNHTEQELLARINALEFELSGYQKLSKKCFDDLERFEQEHGDYSSLLNNYFEIRYRKQCPSYTEGSILESSWYKKVREADNLLKRHHNLVEMFTKCSLASKGRI